jgi:AbrB family looped-hinge helix DNA binding protein
MKFPQPEFFGSTIVSDKGQVVIPVEARTILGLDKGEKLLVMGIDDKCLMLVKADAFEQMTAEMAQRQAALVAMIKEKTE